MDKHISAIVESCFLQLCDFHRIRPLISKTAAITLAKAFVHSHLDYSNSLFYDFPKYFIHRNQNTTARTVTCTSCFTHITPILKTLHWLSVLYCINFKICCLTHRAISLGEPYYLRSLLSDRLYSHSLRSSYFSPLVVPCLKKVYNAFALSLTLLLFFGTIYLMSFFQLSRTSFRKNLKTYIFTQAFPRTIDSSLY